jgi:uncharacterized protein (DUF2062 family)
MKETSKNRLTLKERFLELWNSNGSPHEIALGVAIGVFIGITPFYGFHFITAILTALVLKRANKVAIFLGMNISLPPTIPFITWAGYSIGRKVLGGSYLPMRWNDMSFFTDGTFIHFFYTLLVGSLILGAALSGLFYLFTFWLFNRRKVRLSFVEAGGV